MCIDIKVSPGNVTSDSMLRAPPFNIVRTERLRTFQLCSRHSALNLQPIVFYPREVNPPSFDFNYYAHSIRRYDEYIHNEIHVF